MHSEGQRIIFVRQAHDGRWDRRDTLRLRQRLSAEADHGALVMDRSKGGMGRLWASRQWHEQSAKTMRPRAWSTRAMVIS